MRITDIRPVKSKKNRYSIFLDDEFFCSLHVDILLGSRLECGREISEEEITHLHRQSEEKITRERALRLLGARSYTKHGLYEKLLAYADEDCAAAAVARMEELGLLNDEDYARRYAADCRNLKGYAPRRIAQELARKGIDRDTAEAVLEEMDDDPEPAIAQVIVRKYLRNLHDEKGAQRIIGALARMGYAFGDIRTVIAHLQEDESYYSNWDGD